MKLGVNFRKLNVYYFNIFSFCDSSDSDPGIQ